VRRWAPTSALHPNPRPNRPAGERLSKSVRVTHADAGANPHPVGNRKPLTLELAP